MYKAGRPANTVPLDIKAVPTERLRALVQRMRALSVKDKELARLLQELAPYLPPEPLFEES